MHVVEDLILCMAVPSAGDACDLQVEQTKCIRWEQLLFPQVRHPVSPSSVKIERSHTFGQILWSFCKVSIAPAVEKPIYAPMNELRKYRFSPGNETGHGTNCLASPTSMLEIRTRMIFSLNASLKSWSDGNPSGHKGSFAPHTSSGIAQSGFFQGTVRRQLPRKQGHLPVEIIIQHVVLGFKAAVKVVRSRSAM